MFGASVIRHKRALSTPPPTCPSRPLRRVYQLFIMANTGPGLRKRKLGTNKGKSKETEIVVSEEDVYLPSPDDSFGTDGTVTKPPTTRSKKVHIPADLPATLPDDSKEDTPQVKNKKAPAKTTKAGPSKSKGRTDAAAGYGTRLQTFEWILYAGRSFTATAAKMAQMEVLKSQSRCAELNAARRADEARKVTLELEIELKRQEAEARANLTAEERHQEYEKAMQDMRNEGDRLKARLLTAENDNLSLRKELAESERSLQQAKRDLSMVEIQKTRAKLDAARG
ncbi:hypothetical protein FRC08_002048 [Ceratobasidium sp. 394]|nr:hypothetical protein FRC08_002048 [Ceratobasidium sp. 394]